MVVARAPLGWGRDMRRMVLSVLLAGVLTGLPGIGWAQSCDFVAPDEWSSATSIRWFGPCAGKTADGLGVLRSYFNGKAGPAFFGRMSGGAPAFGVVESDAGFAAGRFVGGEVVATDNRQTIIDAFATAAKAARAVSARFRAENNAGSAKFYADKADQLESQMD